jgi:beta-lactamase superfamily II metal-dependent hydrolase
MSALCPQNAAYFNRSSCNHSACYDNLRPLPARGAEVKCEIEFLAVGSGNKAGDAIVVRYGDETAYELMLIDGGIAETGDKIVAHLKKHFGQTPVLEHVLLIHSDADHASGLRTVLKEIQVKNLYLHLPWFLSAEAITLFKDKRWAKEGLQSAIKKEYDIISEIYDTARSRGCKVYYPLFQGYNIGPFTILSPSRNTYLYLLPQFEKTPDPDQTLIEAASMWIGKASTFQKLFELAKAKVEKWTTETWNQERLKDGGATSANNESSVVLYETFDSGHVLLTGDAGVRALTWAADHADSVGFALQQFSFVQIPIMEAVATLGPQY